MLAWGDRVNGFNDEEIRAVIAYIRWLGGNIQAQPDSKAQLWARGDASYGATLFTSNCAGCHGKNGVGADGPALNNKMFLSSVSDTFLVGTITRGRSGTVMQGFGDPSPIRRALTQAEVESIVVYIRSLGAK